MRKRKEKESKIEPVASEVEHVVYTLLHTRQRGVFPRGACRAYPILAATCRALRRAGVPFTVKRKAKQKFYPHCVTLLLSADKKLLAEREEEVIGAARELETAALYYNVQKLLLRAPFVALADSYRPFKDERIVTTLKQLRSVTYVNPYTAAFLSSLCTKLKVEHAVRWSPTTGATLLFDYGDLKHVTKEVRAAAIEEARRAMWLTFCCDKVTLLPLRIDAEKIISKTV